ncbi:hypothetical protein GGI15_004574 [Coemansia interrupta]|uniref:Uncharacterized protein n=1 Tax=Coemansia interrupta TaxID=1126814 RepID=A0A9W8LEK8_9FUNG|nr:hypothetical protein GGI15_004574 [Coemansia interrupta]
MKNLFIALLFMALFAAVLSAPVNKRGDGPMLALPEKSETVGSYLGRLIGPLPLVGPVTALLGIPPPK